MDMKTTLFKLSDAVNEGVNKPKYGVSSIPLIGRGDNSSLATLSIWLHSFTPQSSVEDRIISIEGGSFVINGEDETSYEWVNNPNVITVTVKVTGEVAFIYISRNARVSFREENTDNLDDNTPVIDWANLNIINQHHYRGVFRDNKRFITDISSLKVSGYFTSDSMLEVFRGSNVDADIHIDTTGVIRFNGMLQDTPYFNSRVDLMNMDDAVSVNGFIRNARSFNQPIPQTLSKVTSMNQFGRYAVSFNQPVGHFRVENCLSMEEMWYHAYNFDQDLSEWDFNVNVRLQNFISQSGMSQKNYSKLLIKLASIDWTGRTQPKVLGATGVMYDASGAAARQELVDDGWTITDGGQV